MQFCEYILFLNLSAKLQLSSGCQLALSYTSEDVSGSPNLALLLAALHIFSAVPLKVIGCGIASPQITLY